MIKMRERKYIKFRADMYDGTKFKIIDMKPERDLIHYVWARVVTLAGKVNLEGDLYMSKSLPYKIETLAIEFNRGEDQIKLALDVFIELEMLELTDGNVYRVKNFAKHQNIKVKEKIKCEDKEYDVKNREVVIKEASKNEMCDNEDKVGKNEAEEIENDDKKDLEITISGIDKANNMSSEKINNSSQDNIPILLETKKNKKVNRKKKKDELFDIADEEGIEDNVLGWFTDGDDERPLGEGERVILELAF
jgi:predicted phage replisome organizer